MTVTISADNTNVVAGATVTFTIGCADGIETAYIIFSRKVNGSWQYYSSSDTYYGEEPYPTSCTISYQFTEEGEYQALATVAPPESSYERAEMVITVSSAPDSLSFSDDSYYACNGNASVSCTLKSGNTGVGGFTVSLTGTGSNLTAVTDSSGVATFDLTSISSNLSLTCSYSSLSDTASVIVGESTLNGSLVCLGRRMASHLTTMGVVDADPSDGLTTLADKILDVEPSISGLDLETEITASASSTSIDVGDTVTFTGILSAYYDDETVTDVDLQGVLQGATVLIKEGSTTLASGTTDTTGAYSITNTFNTSGTHTVKAVFEGTDNFKDCESSSISISVASITPVVTSVSLTSDKSILSYADSETATLTATVLDQFNQPMENETVSFAVVGGSTIGSDTTDSNGEATVSYSSEGAGDLNIQASCGTLLSEIYEVEDCDYYSTTTYTSTTEINKTLLNSTACTVEFDIVKVGSTSGAYLHIGTDSNNFIGVGLIGSGYYGFLIQHNGSRETTQTDSSLGNGTFHTVLTYNNGSITCVINNKTKNYTFTQPISKVLKADCWSSGQIKNIKVKPL